MHDISYLFNIVALLFTAVFVVVIFRQFRLSPVLGYLVAGAAIGENGFNYIQSTDVALLAEFGVVFLLFTIAIELTLERLMSMRNHVFGFGGLQVVLTGFAIYFIAISFGMDENSAIIIGGAFALSSTAMVMGILSEKGIQSNQVGRLSISVLLMQDFAVVPLLILVPLLNKTDSSLMSVLTNSMIEACIGMFIVFFAGRMIIRPIYKLIVAAKNEELFIATTLLLVLGASYATHAFGLSLALGAFIAGLLVAETQYNLQVEESIKPFKGLLLGLFFMTVGMTIDLNFIGEKLMIIVLLSICLIVVKAIIIIMLCKVFKFTLGASIQSGLLLAQGSEFAFVLFTYAQQESVISTEISQILLMIVTTTMAVTPLLVQLGTKLADKFDNKEINITQSSQEYNDMERFVIICGFGRVGKMVSRLFSEHRLNYIVMDINAQTVLKGKKAGYPIFRGDAGREHTLKEIELERAEAVIVTISNIITCERIVKNIRTLCPKIPIIVRAADLRYRNKLKKCGATSVVPETYETGLQLGGELLKSIGVSEFNISQVKNQFRAGNYAWAKEVSIVDEFSEHDDNQNDSNENIQNDGMFLQSTKTTSELPPESDNTEETR